MKWVREGLYPDVIALFHNQLQERPYSLIVNLKAKLIINKKGNGAGRLDKIFESAAYPNLRDGFMADIADFGSLFTKVRTDATHYLRNQCVLDDDSYRFLYQLRLCQLLVCRCSSSAGPLKEKGKGGLDR